MSDTVFTTKEALDAIRDRSETATATIQDSAGWSRAMRVGALLAARKDLLEAAKVLQWAADDLSSGDAP